MEFERSIFRVHDKLLRGPRSKDILGTIEKVFLFLTIYSLVNFLMFHYLYVDKNDILKSAIEQQMKPYFYDQYNISDEFMKTLPLNYTEDTGKFIFDNRT